MQENKSTLSQTIPSAVDYLPLVQRVAKRLGRRLPTHISMQDLVSAGVVGLLEAMQRFDPSRATQFAAFAEFRIKGAILDELRRGDMMARDARTEVKRLEQAVSDLTQALGRMPSEEEMAQELGVDCKVLAIRLKRLSPVRLSSFDDTTTPSMGETETPFDIVARNEMQERLARCLNQLPQRQQQVLHLYYVEDLNLREIGVVLEVSESRVCQIISAATLQLRVLFKESKLNG